MSNNCKHSNKELQQVTDFTAYSTRKAIAKLKTDNPRGFEELLAWLIDKANEAFNKAQPVSGEADHYQELTAVAIEIGRGIEVADGYRRDAGQGNRFKVISALHKGIIEENRILTPNELTQRTGLSRKTIHKHLKQGVGAELYQEELEAYKLMSLKALNALYKIGMMNNDVKALRAFLDYTGGAGPRTIRQQNNYLQVNNTRIDAVTIEALPEAARQQIEEIITQYTAA